MLCNIIDFISYIYNGLSLSPICADQRFIPSEFGNEVDRISPLPPFQECCDKKKAVRRAAEESGIPYTFVSANTFGAYFVNFLLRPYDEKSQKVTIYGTGEAKCKSLLCFSECKKDFILSQTFFSYIVS